ncbi:MAG: serine protease [Duncaniella sp.]|nr:serine protease [Duncaniella sp.]
MAQATVDTIDTIPPFEMEIIDGNMPKEKPELSQRINGSKGLIIVCPSNSSTIDELLYTSIYEYFKGLGMPVKFHYAVYNKDQIPAGDLNIINGICMLSDIDFVDDPNTLVLIPDYKWGYAPGWNRLDIYLNIYDVIGGYQWKETIDELGIDVHKKKIDKNFLKQMRKKVTSEYIYNPELSLRPTKIKFSWGREEFKTYLDKEGVSNVEGIYEINGVRYGIHIDEGGNCNIIYLAGGKSVWEEGELKGVLEATSIPNVYKGLIFDKNYNNRSATVMFEDGLISISLDDGEFKSYMKMYPKSTVIENKSKEEWTGTGIALNDGYVVTNYHVIESANSILINGIDGDINYAVEASVVGFDKNNDLALLRITDSKFKGFGNIPYSIIPSTIEVGEDIYVLGYPMTSTMGDEIKLTTGVISSRTGFQGDVSQYQISAPIQPGNSGGPLFDKNGNIVGVVSAKHKDAENVGYAIKTLYLINLVESCANSSIIPNTNTISKLPLSGKVKNEKNYIFIIKCAK